MLLLLLACEKETAIVEQNNAPVIESLTDPGTIESGATTTLFCEAYDKDKDQLTYIWSGDGNFSSGGASVQWTAPETNDDVYCTIKVKVSDGAEYDQKTINVIVKAKEPELVKLELKAVEDTYIDPNSRDQNWGSRQDLQVYEGKIPYFKFNISSIPKNATITKASFRPIIGFNNSSVKPYGNVTFYHVSSLWSEHSLTYNNRILSGNNYVTGMNNVKFDVAQMLDVDVAYELKDYIKNPPQGNELVYNRFCMKIESTDGGYFYSREVSGYEPILYVEYIVE
ncbi:MAG: DNRLRE domain-containing protein [Bacteroidetes bacterium]|nr:DNRLRE domain-containing protein [Bacteroidota bacterium]